MWQTDSNSAPSPADLELVPKDWERRLDAVKIALPILSKQWKFLESIVAELVKHDAVSSDRVAVLAAYNMIQGE